MNPIKSDPGLRWTGMLLLGGLILTMTTCDGGGPGPVLDVGGRIPGGDAEPGVDTPPVEPPTVDIEGVEEELVPILSGGETIKAWIYVPRDAAPAIPVPASCWSRISARRGPRGTRRIWPKVSPSSRRR